MMLVRLPLFVFLLVVGGRCASTAATPRADFGIGTERIAQVGNRVISWGHEVHKRVDGKRVPAGYQPTNEIVYAGVQGASIVLNHMHYRSVLDGRGALVWILAGSQTTYHPVAGETLTVAGVAMDIKRADGNSIHFVVRSMGAAPSETISGPSETVAGPEPTRKDDTPKDRRRLDK